MDNLIYPAGDKGHPPVAALPRKKWKWRIACRIDDVPRDGGACVRLNNEQIAIFHFSHRGEWFATQNECPHKQQMALSRGLIGSAGPENEPKLACPFHKKAFSLLSGECLSGDPLRIAIYPVRIRNGKVFVGMEK